MANPKQFLEWHGQQWRVVVKVPAKLRDIIGRTKLKQPLHTADLKQADERKWAVVERFKALLAAANRALTTNDPLEAEALRNRLHRDEQGTQDHIHDRAKQLEVTHGADRAKAFYEVASGQATPLDHHADGFKAHKATYSMGAVQDFERVLGWLVDWLKADHRAASVEAVTRQTAGRFIDQHLTVGRSRDKAAAYLGFLREYWKWLKQRGHVSDNPWVGQDLPAALRPSRDAEPDGDKRAYTDAELARLIYGPASERLADLMCIAALSGMRIEEVCQLRLVDCEGGAFNVRAGKTEAAKRHVPIHTGLAAIMARRTKGKLSSDFLIDGLPDVPASRESRSDPASKEFTRYRRKQKVDERPNGKPKSNVDFHSFRRWFIHKARAAMLEGNAGFDEWTFPAVIGHTESERPKSLDLAMMGYAGKDPEKAKRALVESVKLPPHPPQ
ncbi:DUF6538 domain-containing protein [Mesorhizobium kowhaii]|uniref:DUF6538 domain-containing protein n=1 Tax=Mesorhizobium kowhaii TaxID=1300272 RepID=UPI0035EB4E62